MKIHIYHHFPQEDNCEVIRLLKEISSKLDLLLSVEEDEQLKEQIMAKLNSAISDIKSTIS